MKQSFLKELQRLYLGFKGLAFLAVKVGLAGLLLFGQAHPALADDPLFTAPLTNPFGLRDVGDRSNPAFVDIDGDGDLDAFVGSSGSSGLFYFQNTGSPGQPTFAAPVTNILVITELEGGAPIRALSPAFADIDGDGDFDAFIGTDKTKLKFFRNTGTVTNPTFAPEVTNPFGMTISGSFMNPTLADLDGDDDFDIILGYVDRVEFYENTGSSSAATYTTPVVNAFGLVPTQGNPDPVLADIDLDGDLDAFLGGETGGTFFYRNSGTPDNPAFAAPLSNPFGLVGATGGGNQTPTLADIDGDGDLDSFMGGNDGKVYFFRNLSQLQAFLPLLLKNFSPLAKKWTSQTSGVTQGLNEISCPSATTCFAVGNSGTILKTTNGGASWSPQAAPLNRHLNSISCPSTTLCFAAGEAGTIFRTTNGSTWSTLNSGTSQPLRGISCGSASDCLAVGGDFPITTTSIYTTNGGDSWRATPKLGNTALFGVHCPASDRCVLVGNFGRIQILSGNALVGSFTLGPIFYGVHCPTSTTCFVVGENGAIFTSDNGVNWGSRPSGTAHTLLGVSCPDALACTVVGANGTIRTTASGGAVWFGESSNTSVSLSGVACPNESVCWAVGENGTILIGQ